MSTFGYASGYMPRDSVYVPPGAYTPGGQPGVPVGGYQPPQPGGFGLPPINFHPDPINPIQNAPYSSWAPDPIYASQPGYNASQAYAHGQNIYAGAGNPFTGYGIGGGSRDPGKIFGTGYSSNDFSRGVNGWMNQVNRLNTTQLQNLTQVLPQVSGNFSLAAQNMADSSMSNRAQGQDFLQAAYDQMTKRLNNAYLL